MPLKGLSSVKMLATFGIILRNRPTSAKYEPIFQSHGSFTYALSLK